MSVISKFSRILAAIAAFGTLGTAADAAVITTLDFSNAAVWSTTLTQSGGTNDSAVVGGSITAEKSGASGGVRIAVDLIGTISTVGFQNISLAFDGIQTGLEWNGNLTNPVNSTDGLRIVGDGVEINANSLNDITGSPAEADFTAGATFPNANFGTDFSFDAAVDNSQISNLSFILQVNAGPEEISLSSVQILGDAVVASVPEPSSFAVLGLLCGGFVIGHRRQRSPSKVATML